MRGSITLPCVGPAMTAWHVDFCHLRRPSDTVISDQIRPKKSWDWLRVYGHEIYINVYGGPNIIWKRLSKADLSRNNNTLLESQKERTEKGKSRYEGNTLRKGVRKKGRGEGEGSKKGRGPEGERKGGKWEKRNVIKKNSGRRRNSLCLSYES